MQLRHLFVLLVFAAAAFADEECPPRYSYCGYSGPKQWPNLIIPNTKNECGGERQSPINMLPPETSTPGPAIFVEYHPGNAIIRNTGHDILVTPTGDAGQITIGQIGNVYKLLQLHFHVPSEHQLNGTGAPAEMHIVHQLKVGHGDEYAVIGVMLSSGTAYEALEPVFANLPEKVCETSGPVRIAFDKLMPKEVSSYYTYAGSLTTPPCTESVLWYVLPNRQTICASEMRKLSALGENARPIQRRMNVTFIRSQ
jgi:carbonic anhydrase